MFDDGLFMLLSGTGEVVRVDPEARKYETIARLPGFVRGMDRIGQYLFVGLSKIRKGSDFQHLGLAASSLQCGLAVIDQTTGKVIGNIEFLDTVEEIYDVQVLTNTRKPEIMHPQRQQDPARVTTPEQNYLLSTTAFTRS